MEISVIKKAIITQDLVIFTDTDVTTMSAKDHHHCAMPEAAQVTSLIPGDTSLSLMHEDVWMITAAGVATTLSITNSAGATTYARWTLLLMTMQCTLTTFLLICFLFI